MYRDTVFTIIVYLEMYRDTIFMTEIYPDMYHDTVSLFVSSRFSCVLCFCGCTRALPWCCLALRTHVSLPMFISRFTVESVQCRNESIERHPVSRVVQRTLAKYAALFVGVDRGGNLALFLVVDQVGNLEFSRSENGPLSRGMKVNEFADLTTSEFVSEYTEEKLNIVWSGRKHLETHEYINEPLDQVKSDSCSQSSNEGPSFVFLCRLESELNCR